MASDHASAHRLLRLMPGELWLALGALVLVLTLGVVFNANGAFFRPGTHADALWQISGFGVLACGMTVVILTAGIDLSVGSVVALSGMVFFMFACERTDFGWQADPGASRVVAVMAGVLVGGAAGATCGVLVGWLRLQPFIATLAMMAFARGLAKNVTNNQKIAPIPSPEVADAINARFGVLGFNVSVSILIFIVCALLTVVVLRMLTVGRYIYAVGDNEEAARLSGVPVRAVKLFAYTFCGVYAGIAGVLFASAERQGNPDGGVAYELSAIAMVVVGGTSLMGGRGGVGLTVLGALTIGYLRKILNINNVQTAPQLMITGGIIVLAVLVQGFRRR